MSRSFGGRPDPEKQDDSRWSYGREHGAEEQSAVEPLRVDRSKRLVAGLIDVLAGYLLEIAVNCIPVVNMVIQDQIPLMAFLLVRDALFGGRGLGKNLMGMQVVDIKTGQPASFRQSIIRNIVICGPYLTLYTVNLLLRLVPNDAVNPVVHAVVTGIGSLYTIAVIPYEGWRVYAREDGLRWGDEFAGTAIVPSDTDFSSPFSK